MQNMMAAPRTSFCKKQKAGRCQKTLIDAPHQKSRNGGDDKLGNACHQHDLADFERVVRSDIGQKDGHQIDRPKKPGTEHETEQTADRKIPVAEGAQVH
jgi:hypothetical protein